MKVLKYISRFLIFLVIGVVIAAVVIPVVFKDDIIAGLRNAVNDYSDAEINFSDVDLSIISSFPNAGVDIKDLTIVGKGDFEGKILAAVDNLSLEVSIPSVINKDQALQVRAVDLINPDINIIINKSGEANYDIFKNVEKTEAEGDFIMQLKKYKITNGDLTYRDAQSDVKFLAKGVNHSGSGNFVNEKFDLDTRSTISDLSVFSGGVNYLSHGTAKADAIVAVDLATNSYTLKDNELTVNALDVDLDGNIKINTNSIDMDMNFSAPSEDARGLMSVIPGFYSKNFKDAQVDGKASLSGFVRGNYNSKKGSYPAFKLNSEVINASLKYPSLPKALSMINFKMDMNASQGNYNDMVIAVPTLSMKVGENLVKGHLMTKDLDSDPFVEGALIGDITLSDWKSAMPLTGIEELSGLIKSDIAFAGKKSDVEAKNYNALKLSGTFKGSDIKYKTVGNPAITIAKLNSTLSPESVVLNTSDLKAGSSDASGNITITNPLAYFHNEGQMNTKITTTSKNINLNDWISESDNNNEQKTVIPATLANVTIDAKADKFTYGTHTIKGAKLKGVHKNNSLAVKNLSGTMGSSDFTLKGDVQNTLGYFNEGEVLTGALVLTSTNLDMADFTSESDGQSTKDIVIIPDNMDITIQTNVAKAKYDDILLNSLKGDIKVADQEAVLENGNARGLGGNVTFSGLYGTPPGEQPDFAFKYDLSKLDFEKTFASVELTRKLAPLMKHIDGTFNSTLIMEGKLDENMIPNISTLDASGFVETLAAQLEKFEVGKRLADLLGIEALRKIDLDHTKNWFEIIDGFVELKPFQKNVAGIDMQISGSHGLKKDMSYEIIMDVPREMLKKNSVTGAADKGMQLLEREANKLGVKLDLGDFIKLKVDIGGSLSSPSFKVTPLGSGGQASVNDIIKDEIEDIKETVKDSVKTIIKETEETIKDTVDATVKIVKDSVNTVIDETVDEVKDTVTTIIINQVEDQLDEVLGDSSTQVIKEEVIDIINTNTGGTVDDLKDKIEGWNPFKKKKGNN